MTGCPRRARSEAGFTLVETMAALLVFALVTVGIVPLMVTSIRGTALSRSDTVGKNVALEAMERIRGLPYAIAYGVQAKKVDVLDMYFPCADSSMTAAACQGGGTRSYWDESGGDDAGVFQITCDDTTDDPACATQIPAGHTVTFRSRFTNPEGTGTVFPLSGYAWDSTTNADTPPSQLLDVTVTTAWTVNGGPRSVTLQSLVGDRKFADINVGGTARLSYGVQVQTRYDDEPLLGGGVKSDLRVVAGSLQSRVESRLVGTARQRVRAAEASLAEEPTDSFPDGRELVDTLLGALSEAAAPPTSSLATVFAGSETMTHPTHPDGPQIAGWRENRATEVNVAVADEIPSAQGKLVFDTGPANEAIVWVQSDVSADSELLLHLDTSRRMFQLRNDGHVLVADSHAVTAPVEQADRRVETFAQMDLKNLRMFPVTNAVIPAGNPHRTALRIENFKAEVRCESTADAATAVAEATWSGDLYYWKADELTSGQGEFVQVPISDAAGDVRLRDVIGENPRVYRAPTSPAGDVYLFEEGLNSGYLLDFNLRAPSSSKSDDGQLTSAVVEEAINITTVPTNPNVPESGLSVSVGKLSCDALDKR